MFSCYVVRSLNHSCISNRNSNFSKFWIISYFYLGKEHIHVTMNPSSRNKSFFPKLSDKSSCSFLCSFPIPSILIVLNSLSESSYFSFDFLSLFFCLLKEFWVFHWSVSHYFCNFCLNLDFTDFFLVFRVRNRCRVEQIVYEIFCFFVFCCCILNLLWLLLIFFSSFNCSELSFYIIFLLSL
jgi:hypothetical protein